MLAEWIDKFSENLLGGLQLRLRSLGWLNAFIFTMSR
jgi:hypothetical protein